MNFEVPIAEQKVKPHQVTALHLIAGFAVSACSAIILLLNNTVLELPGTPAGDIQKAQIAAFDITDIFGTLLLISGIVIIISALFRNRWLRSPKVNRIFRSIELIISIAVAIFLLTKAFYIPAALFGVLAAAIIFAFRAENGVSNQLFVTVNDKGIHLPSISKKRHLDWAETERVILRHGTLTINSIDNRMYQWVTATHQIDSNAFEAFSAAKIVAAEKDRNKTW